MNSILTTTWEEHFEQTRNKPPRPQLLKALSYVKDAGGAVLELGGGALNDARHLLSLGMKVTVIDSEPSIEKIAKEIGNDQLTVYVQNFDQYAFPEEAYNLVTAMYALSFNPPETFHDVMANVKKSLVQGGIFSCNIFGPKDDWSHEPTMTFLDKSQIEELFADMEILSLEEVERDNILAGGIPKHWHEFQIIARKV